MKTREKSLMVREGKIVTRTPQTDSGKPKRPRSLRRLGYMGFQGAAASGDSHSVMVVTLTLGNFH